MTIEPTFVSVFINTKHRFHISQAQRTKKTEHHVILNLGYLLILNKVKESLCLTRRRSEGLVSFKIS